jgi:UDP-glucose 4-epimerase
MINKKILLVGANGIIGKDLYEYLSDNFLLQTIVSNRCENKKYDFAVDLRDKVEVDKVISRIEPFSVLIFLVGLAHSKGSSAQFEDFYDGNFNTLKNLLSSLSDNEIKPDKIIYTSSISVYGERLDVSSYQEDSLLIPKSPYAKTKLMAENFLTENYQDKSWILRLAPVYSKNIKFNIMRRTLFLNIPYIVNRGRYRLSLCNMKNITHLVLAIINDEFSHGIYNISDKQSYSYLDLHQFNKSFKYIIIPTFIIKVIFFIGKMLNKQFLIENSIKLISDNIYPSDKVRNYKDLPHSLKEL